MAVTYDQSGFTYDQVSWVYDQASIGSGQSFSMGCKIAVPGSQTIQLKTRIQPTLMIRARIVRGQITCKARIVRGQFLCQAKIRKPATRNIQAKTFVVWQQGYPVRDPSDPGFKNFTPTQLIVKANIVNRAVKTAQTTLINAHISPKRSTATTIQARIGHGSQIKIGANVQPKFFTSIATGVFNIAALYQSEATMQFSIPGLYSVQSIGMGANIIRLVTKKATMHFTIPAITATGKVDTIAASATPMSNAQLGMGCYIS